MSKPSGRPVGPLIPCGWCHQEMTTSRLRSHLAVCPDRPNVWANAPVNELEEWAAECKVEAENFIKSKSGEISKSDAVQRQIEQLTCQDDEGEL